MNAETCLEKLSYVGVLSFATVGEQGEPEIRCISAIHYEPNAIYFYTARGKDFCKELEQDGRVQVLGYTKYKEMIRLSGTAKAVPEEEQAHWKDVIFDEQPYLANVYPGDTRSIGIIFAIREMSIEYFNLGVNPIFREVYSVNGGRATPKGYVISDQCVGCGTCQRVCPQRAIDEGTPYHIRPENCLHCGNCFQHCPIQAVQRL